MTRAQSSARFGAVVNTLKRYWIPVAVVFGLFVFSGLVMAYRSHQKAVAESKLCRTNSSLLQQLQTKSEANKLSEADALVKKVTNLTDYTQSADCTFVLAQYYLTVDDLENAESYHSLFVKSGSKVSTPLLKNVYENPVDYLQKRIDFLKTIRARNNTNFVGIGEATE